MFHRHVPHRLGSPTKTWGQRRASNPQPSDYKSDALPFELHRHLGLRERFELSSAPYQGAVLAIERSQHITAREDATAAASSRLQVRPLRMPPLFGPLGAGDLNRTGDLSFTKALLCQLSYTGKTWRTGGESNSRISGFADRRLTFLATDPFGAGYGTRTRVIALATQYPGR